jgi:8-oxo-dGTP pyrophosphatase MutT (NUDIX family)
MSENKITTIANKIRFELESELPGKKSHYKMIPETRKTFSDRTGEKQAAVMILLFPENSDINISFIKRTEYEGVHSGQIGFPGGMREKIDRDLLDTVLRETAEETGVDSREIEIMGKLSTLHIPVSNFQVQPFAGYLDFTPTFSPEPTEVEYMINIPLKHFYKSASRKKEKWNLSGIEMLVPFFSYQDFKIWGATAMMLMEFLDITEAIVPDL